MIHEVWAFGQYCLPKVSKGFKAIAKTHAKNWSSVVNLTWWSFHYSGGNYTIFYQKENLKPWTKQASSKCKQVRIQDFFNRGHNFVVIILSFWYKKFQGWGPGAGHTAPSGVQGAKPLWALSFWRFFSEKSSLCVLNTEFKKHFLSTFDQYQNLCTVTWDS